MDKKGQMITIFFSFFLIIMIITLISIESSNLSTNKNVNSLVQAFTIPKIQYYSYLNVLSQASSITLSNQTISTLSSTLNNIYNNYFNDLSVSNNLLNASNFFIQLPNKPPQILSYAPITFSNLQNVPTPSPFQQMVNAPYAVYGNYSNSELSNVEFFYFNGTVIPSWLESYNANGARWWIKIGNIPASSSITVYMGFAPKNTNLFNTVNDGEAPQIPCGSTPTSSCTNYAEYDDGANVFNFYSDFKGNSLNKNKWNDSEDYVVSNGITLSPPSTSLYSLYSLQNFGAGSTLDFYGTVSNDTASGGGYDFGFGDCVNCATVSPLLGQPEGYGGNYGLYYYSSGSYTITNYLQNTGIWTVGLLSNQNEVFSEFNYGDEYTLSSTTAQTAQPIDFTLHSGISGDTSITWVAIRSTPPNGVMPNAYFSGDLT